MSDSEDSDLDEGPNVTRYRTKIVYESTYPYVHLEPPDVIYERWDKISVEEKKKMGHLLHVAVFWWHILIRQQDNHTTTTWAVQMGFLDSNVSNDLSLRRLDKIEILESILRAMEKGILRPDLTRQLISISTSFSMNRDCLADAMRWLEQAEGPYITSRVQELGPRAVCVGTLEFIFNEYSHYVKVMGCSRKRMRKDLCVTPEKWHIDKSEEMKNKGNELFQKKKYDVAVKWYSKAIKFHSENHILYGNRALCYLRSEKYLKAVGDGKRATLLQPHWAKGHYRFCDGLFYLGEHSRALEANRIAQELCSADPDGLRDLQQQHGRFLSEMKEMKAEVKLKKSEAKRVPTKRPESVSRAEGLQHCSDCPDKGTEQKTNTGVTKKEAEERTEEGDATGEDSKTEEGSRTTKEMVKSEMADRKARRAEPHASEKHAVRNKHSALPEKTAPPCGKEQFISIVQDAHTALADQRYRNAEQAFAQALTAVTSSEIKELGLSELDRMLLMYGYAMALLETGQPEELAKAEEKLNEISSKGERTFQSLVLYAMGKVLLKENRFGKALQQFSDALLMVSRQITPGKLTWPTTKVTVKETCLEYLKDCLENSIEICKFPPKPDAVCRHQNCLGHSKTEIYFTDPDFKGFIRLTCCYSCNVEFHISCWKKLKNVSFTNKNDKDLLKEVCLTPDCGGKICHVAIFDSTGLIKCEFESSIPKNTTPFKQKVKQKCTSLKKLKSKEDRKLRRKQFKQSAIKKKTEKTPVEKPADGGTGLSDIASPEVWIECEDRVLHQIRERQALFKDEMVSVTSLMNSLKPWMDLGKTKGHSDITSDETQPQMLGDLVDLLLVRKNRVWARVFVQALSLCQDIKPNLLDWSRRLDSYGLKAAETFIDRYAEPLEEQDLSSLLTFPLLQDVLIERFGDMPEFFSTNGFTITDYLKQAPQQEKRLFIWTLEENRDQYSAFHSILDDYFQLDGICLVIKKTETDNQTNSLKNKSKNRKKKHKEPKPVIVLSGMRTGALREEEEEDYLFSDEDSFFPDRMFHHGYHSSDPFSVPDHLRDQVAEFDGQYTAAGHLIPYKRILDNNPDPAKESLYDYFAQILEEHGPLEADDQLLVGELENFPPEAQQKIQDAGGLKPFLLESLRFVMVDSLVGLMKHSMTLQTLTGEEMAEPLNQTFTSDVDRVTSGTSSHLNPSAKEFRPQFAKWSLCEDDDTSFADSVMMDNQGTQQDAFNVLPVLPGPCPAVPTPYILDPVSSHLINPYPFGVTNIGIPGTVGPEGAPFYDLAETEGSVSSLCSLGNTEPIYDGINVFQETGGGEPLPVVSTEENEGSTKKAVAVQAFWEIKSDVAINTEPYPTFEKNLGDMTAKEKSNLEFEQQLQQIRDDHVTLQQTRKEEVSKLESELEDIHQKIEITNKELSLFQHKLEEEVRKDQQEKKENQETLKTLKGEIKELGELQESYSRDIREKKKEYEAALDQFLEISNQSAAEKMSLEDEIKRCRDLCARAAERSQAAELSILQNRRMRGLRGLNKCVSDGKAILKRMVEVSARHPSAGLLSAIEAWRACVQEAEEKIARTEAQYEEQMELIKRGNRLCTLPSVSVPCAPAPPFVPAPDRTAQSQTAADATPAPRDLLQRHPAPQPAKGHKGPAQQHLSVFERIVDRLSHMFPHYTRPVLSRFIQEVRTANGGCLNTLTYEEIINRVAQLILDHQEEVRERMHINKRNPNSFGIQSQMRQTPPPRADSPASVRSTGTPPPPPQTHAWKSVSNQYRKTSKALNMEDPCIICHEDMAEEDLCVLECRHTFHRECIKSWLKEQSTCPTCREHALLPEDFPMLPGRIRKKHTPAASSS
ncbi:E3 ubiquitin-protein ligase TTC3 isoform X2 [Chanos chanos]|uniref:RING-type E3 ubiquitin transferase n=1 Tax=Chanos chanos TaxID=29144 RepID=A0A6J2WUS6_CHACN|nr:E3 ubiquitin-protein ligase TTC3 isoform X2 [Chanos chanos]